MRVDKLQAVSFRNYERLDIALAPGLNVLYGHNGQGKTNLLEAIYLFCTGKSYRTVHDSECIRFGADKARVKMSFTANERQNTAEIRFGDKKEVSLNGAPVARLSELVGAFHGVLFTPEHLGLIRGGPADRRQFLDLCISQWKPVYFKTLLSYYQVVRQRNSLLKRRPGNLSDQLAIWNEKLFEYGSVISKGRAEAIGALSKAVMQSAGEITNGKEEHTLTYQPSVKGDFCDRDVFLSQIERAFDQEVEKGVSLVGPHRDDFTARLNGRELKKYGSQGQVRTCVLALKLAECEMIKADCGQYPVLLLDDILSELDGGRQEYLLSHISGRQVILTHAGECCAVKGAEAAFYVENGRIERR